MIEKIIDYSARNRFVIFILTGVLSLGAWYGLINIPIDAIPDLSDTQVIVYSKWDRSPDIIEDHAVVAILVLLI